LFWWGRFEKTERRKGEIERAEIKIARRIQKVRGARSRNRRSNEEVNFKSAVERVSEVEIKADEGGELV
jgi:hypothetical protein